MSAYYNELDPFAAQWLRNLIAAGHIAPGDVDERDIRDVRPSDLAGYRQCHFFAGVGVWSYALRVAGVRDDANIWTGSCPCQPFSQAGGGAGFDDERHLWPHFHWLVSQCRPAIVLGEQVASKDGLGWIDLVQADMEGSGYAFGAVDMCAAGFGAPHIRQRLYWVAHVAHQFDNGAGHGGARRGFEHSNGSAIGELADAVGIEQSQRRSSGVPAQEKQDENRLHDSHRAAGGRANGELADMRDARLQVGSIADDRRGTLRLEGAPAPAHGVSGELGAPDRAGPQSRDETAPPDGHRHPAVAAGSGDTGRPTDGFWRAADWLLCRDGKWRAVEPGTFPLAHGAAGRVGRLRAYGNAIVAEQAIAFIEACAETLDLSVEK